MSEPEDLILEGAHFATRVARDVWRRHSAASTAAGVPLAAVRGRLELFVAALFATPIAIAPVEPAAPVTWLSKLARRPGRVPDADPFCGTDGVRVFLPPMLPVRGSEEETIAAYRLLAVQQSARLSRHTLRAFDRIRNDRARDWFMLAEAAVIDYWVFVHTPGLLSALRLARAEALAERRAAAGAYSFATTALEQSVRALLRAAPGVLTLDVSANASPEDCRRWADARASQDASVRPAPPVKYWGALLRPPAVQVTSVEDDGEEAATGTAPPRVAEMRRTPRARQADGDEDDGHAGSWVIRADDPQESVEDPLGLQRPADRDDGANPEDLADSLSDLPEARVVRTRQQPREVLRRGEAPRRFDGPALHSRFAAGIVYPEWDYRIAQYRARGATVRQPAARAGDAAWVTSVRSRHARLIRRVRTRFERLRSRPVRVCRQVDGPEIDTTAYVIACGDRRARVATDGRVYAARRVERRDLVVALLVDVSASTDAWVSSNRRIIDVEKEGMIVVCEALDALGDRYGVFAFSGEGAGDVSVSALKEFEQPSGHEVRRRIAALECDRYTRLGAPIRHVTAALCRQTAAARLLLLLSDGKPNDVDMYDGRYGIEDTRQAVAEARRQGVKVFCLTVDREAPRYALRIFGRAGFSVLRHAEQLPAVVVDVLRHLIRV